uniref:Uncharacterized protein LOC105051616 n=1 Tax=Elaeis guineensis var. tenera TaxID=51953 RepID=A0A6I9RQS4_ELAGV|nr:uncharacterized protein LOC105051616 [Elaeis guineensis]
MPAASRRKLFISWEPPSSGFVKVNFDGSVRDGRDGSRFVIRDLDSRMLVAGGSPLYETSLPYAESHAVWAGVICAIRKLRVWGIIIEENSLTVISWIQEGTKHHNTHPLLDDIWRATSECIAVSSQHVFREANSALDWVASFVVEHTEEWRWRQDDDYPWAWRDILFSDFLGFSWTRLV